MEPDPLDTTIPGNPDDLPPLVDGGEDGYNPVGWWTVIGDTWTWITNPRS